MSNENKIVCPYCGSENKKLYMTSGQLVGHRWVCGDCGKVFEDEVTITTRKKLRKNLLKILASLAIILVILIILMLIV